jgi:hypothetical protein
MLKGWIFQAIYSSSLAVMLSCVTAGVLADEDPTALELIKEGNRYVGEQAKDKVVQLRSEKSVGSLTPKVWYVVYYDPTATFKAVEVKFGAGKMLDVKRPLRVLETITSSDRVLDREKIKIDSNKAIEIATGESLFKDVKINAVSAKLQNGNSGPLWTVKLWAQKLKKPREDADIGEVKISADEGKVVEMDVHLDRVD